ncbi:MULTISPECIES: 16S rRNA (cytidine(1402)-2'-O)-methyltransferase [Geobacillus]|jgi:16S rRNA (cytidine1402-2'-O)-methyltransferase|uniref:16S rRNA (cytidine(1402)-2'-O)-methyltransferase n=1 Tax=Geobacillus TaxID=129337 RepID=UPI00017E3EA4|nr:MULTISPECIES: 16S rRNA (cytidine(1402)-2'-O)-methyltransferase [Geobacillus]ARA98128.1 16S rRNA (cytidine(1402)-2'-O)-methyltransferase [Geobacillus thermodenitrificans]KQB94959.1 Ribosomal RNA small subunit methyltransferase I [Geobacillus sp. PA-3]MED0664676.1 16S rRNA (cytidine(1402)-2'-O)-methyltransferase [Geobacillus thermodenitrificans]PJW19358.1 16S rRNA (cytidine(1402)-2'-O)-methyltransferase [Geobacillus thermodenitrificans]PTR47154.1 16S rRNA (cytidine(1402)-2'-O)-methyltransfera
MLWQQKSFVEQMGQGTLYIVPTPIGNLEDMTFRAVRTLREADVIAAEDTRQTKKLLSHFDIHTPLVSYHEHNKYASGRQLVEWLKEGKNVALVSDAGMPGISDPGYELIVAALAERCRVVPLPGANAALTALVASGLPTGRFLFVGFLERAKKEKREQLLSLKTAAETLVFYEAPHRLKETLAAMYDVFGERRVALCRELTKRFEEFIRGDLSEAIAWAETTDIRGEFCIVVEGAQNGSEPEREEETWWQSLSLVEHVDYYVGEHGLSVKEAVKQAAGDRKMSKRDVYQQYHRQKEKKEFL